MSSLIKSLLKSCYPQYIPLNSSESDPPNYIRKLPDDLLATKIACHLNPQDAGTFKQALVATPQAGERVISPIINMVSAGQALAFQKRIVRYKSLQAPGLPLLNPRLLQLLSAYINALFNDQAATFIGAEKEELRTLCEEFRANEEWVAQQQETLVRQLGTELTNSRVPDQNLLREAQALQCFNESRYKEQGHEFLRLAAKINSLPTVENLLNQGATPARKIPGDGPADLLFDWEIPDLSYMHHSIRNRNEPMLRRFIGAGISLHAYRARTEPAHQWAVPILLEAGADPCDFLVRVHNFFR